MDPSAAVRLQILIPGETADPGQTSTGTPGKTGIPSNPVAGVGFNVTVNAVDQFYNVQSNSAPTVGLNMPNSYANYLPTPTQDLASGTGTFTLTLKRAGTGQTVATTTGGLLNDTTPAFQTVANTQNRLQIVLPGNRRAGRQRRKDGESHHPASGFDLRGHGKRHRRLLERSYQRGGRRDLVFRIRTISIRDRCPFPVAR